MKTVFKKSHLPYLKPVLHGGEGRDNWNIVRTMQDRNGLAHQLPAEIALLSRGAQAGDAWSMCELARNYFEHCGDIFLPQALRLWKLAVLQDDAGAKWDIENRPIRERIHAYRSQDGDFYTEAEMKCAMLAEWHLTQFGTCPWEGQSDSEKIRHCEELVQEACGILRIPTVWIEFVPNMLFNGSIVDGLAHWDNHLSFRAELLPDIERMVEIIFHELGHIVAFEIMRENENSENMKRLYGITDERVRSWRKNAMGYEVPTSEEDPDTLSYGVYTLWGTFFLPHAHGRI